MISSHYLLLNITLAFSCNVGFTATRKIAFTRAAYPSHVFRPSTVEPFHRQCMMASMSFFRDGLRDPSAFHVCLTIMPRSNGHLTSIKRYLSWRWYRFYKLHDLGMAYPNIPFEPSVLVHSMFIHELWYLPTLFNPCLNDIVGYLKVRILNHNISDAIARFMQFNMSTIYIQILYHLRVLCCLVCTYIDFSRQPLLCQLYAYDMTFHQPFWSSPHLAFSQLFVNHPLAYPRHLKFRH